MSHTELPRRTFLALPSLALTPAFAPNEPEPRFLWMDGVPAIDSHVAFRGTFELSAPAAVELRFLGASWFGLWLDGEYLTDGPARFPREHPEYQALRLNLAAGRHLLAAQVHSFGVSTRLLDEMPPFWTCHVMQTATELPVRWTCTHLAGYASGLRRVNPELGWAEWADTRKLPALWRQRDFDDAGWSRPVPVRPGLGTLKPLSTAPVRNIVHALEPAASGQLVEAYGYERDDPPARFFLRRLQSDDQPAQGVWRRYDLGRVRLGRSRLIIDAPPGSVIETAYSEALENGRVNPWITLSLGLSCNLDHFVARGGEQEFLALSPKGGRFVEVHVLAPPSQVRFVREEYVERTYHGSPEGSFHSEDPLLDRIWLTGIETYRACSEDAVIDNPTRERGQWAGDVATVGMEIAAAGFSDLRLFRRGLTQCAECARDDGLVAGLCPGGRAYLTTYAAQWVSACLRYRQLTGDGTLLRELLPAAERNIGAFEKWWTDSGVRDEAGWGFVDWGYVRNEGPVDIGVNLHVAAALRDMVTWCDALGESAKRDRYARLHATLGRTLTGWFAGRNWEEIGLHRAVLGLRGGFIPERSARAAVEFIRRHILNAFPLQAAAPRLSDPEAANPHLFTPYFAHYALPVLMERGEADFVFDVYRKAWGWALEGGRTTWLEVFDTRWSHCHAWAGCPTWQLTRYLLGLDPRFDWGAEHYALRVRPGSMKRMEGAVPVRGGGVIRVEWTRHGDDIHYRLETPLRITLHLDGGETVTVERRFERELRTG